MVFCGRVSYKLPHCFQSRNSTGRGKWPEQMRLQTPPRLESRMSCDAGAKGTRWRRGYRRSRASRQSRGACPGAVLSDADAPRRPPPLCFTKPKTPYMSSKVGAGLHEFKALSANSPPRRCWSLTVSWCSHGHGGEEQRTVQKVRDICGISCIQQCSMPALDSLSIIFGCASPCFQLS